MLRITQTIELKLQKNEEPLLSDFIKGLGLAVGIHALLFCVLRIVSPPNLDAVNPLIPIAVEIDLSTEEGVVLPIVKSNPFSLEAPEAPDCFDMLHELSAMHVQKEPFSAHEIALPLPDFSPLEKISYSPLSHILEEEDD